MTLFATLLPRLGPPILPTVSTPDPEQKETGRNEGRGRGVRVTEGE